MIEKIEAHARVSFKQQTKSGDVFYTYEYSETRSVSDNVEEEREKLWTTVNEEVDKQIRETKNLYST